MHNCDMSVSIVALKTITWDSAGLNVTVEHPGHDEWVQAIKLCCFRCDELVQAVKLIL